MITLKKVLMLNGISSGATGLGLLVFAPFFAELLALKHAEALYATGAFLLLFALFVLYSALQQTVSAALVSQICALDVLWVLGSLAILVFGLFQISFIGYVLIAGVALWVATMAGLQWRGLMRLAN